MLPVPANVKSSQVSVNSSTVSGIIKYLPANLWPHSDFINVNPAKQKGHVDHDFIVVAEFCEIVGPKPTIILPEEYSMLFDLDEYMLRIFSADTSGLQFSTNTASLMSRPDCESCVFDKVTGTHSFVHYLTLRDLCARGFVRPFAVVYITPSEEKLKSQMDRISCILRTAVGDFRRSNNNIFSMQLIQKLETITQDDPKFEQYSGLLSEFSQSLDKPVSELTDLVKSQIKTATEDSPDLPKTIGSLWDLCGQSTVDNVQQLFTRLLENLSGTPAALSVASIRSMAVDFTATAVDGNRSLVFMNRFALLPKIPYASHQSLQNNSEENADNYILSSTEHLRVQQTYDVISLRSDRSDSTITMVESISPTTSELALNLSTLAMTANVSQTCAVTVTCNKRETPSEYPPSFDSGTILELTLPYLVKTSWPLGIMAEILENNHKTIAQALTWLAVGLPLVIAGEDVKFLQNLSSELASLAPSSSIFINEEVASVRGITIVSTGTSVRSPLDLPTSSPSLWVSKEENNNTTISAWGPQLTYQPFVKLFRRLSRFNFSLPIIQLIVANHWTFLVQLAFLLPIEASEKDCNAALRILGRHPADDRFMPAALSHLRWLAALK